MSTITREQITIDYNSTGAGEYTLLFIHGSYIDQTYWDSQAKYFGGRFRVVTLDLPGHGKSGKDREAWSLEAFAQDVNALISELGLRNVILIGHSMGAQIALYVAADNKNVVGLISVDYFKNAATPMPKDFANSILKQLKKDFVGTNEQYARSGLLSKHTSPSIVDKVVKDYRSAYEPMGMQLMGEMGKLYMVDRELLPKLKMKLYIISVTYMPVLEEPLKKYAKSGYELRLLEGTSHYPMLEIPVQLNTALDTFIRQIIMEYQRRPKFVG